MENLYCNVVDGVILQGPIRLPPNFKIFNDIELKTAGWIPAIIIKPQPDLVFNTLVGPEIIISEDLITFQYSLERLDEDAILSNLKKIKYELINNERDKMRSEGFHCNGYTYDSDMISLINVIGKMVELLIAVTIEKKPLEEIEPFIWRTKDNQDVPHTISEFVDVFKSLAEYGTTLYITSWLKKKNLMENINTLDEVDQFSPLLT